MATQPQYINLLTYQVQTCLRISFLPKPIKSLFLFWLFLFISFCTSHTIAQLNYKLDKTTRFEKLGTEQGLSIDFTLCMHQDKYGFMWIGTNYGLNFYDGNEVKVFMADPENPETLPNNYIDNIFEEDDGTMWICTDLGISKYNRANQTFTTFTPDTINLDNPNNVVESVLKDGDNLWLDVQNDFLRFNTKTETFQSFTQDTLNPGKGIYGTDCEFMYVDRSGVPWVCSGIDDAEYVLNRFDKETETFTYFEHDPDDPESFNGKRVKSILEDHEGTLWLATWGGGLLEGIDKKKGRFRQYSHNDIDTNSIINDYLLVAFEDARRNLWVGGRGGFSQFVKKTRQFVNYRIPPYSTDYNRTNHIDGIVEDDKGLFYMNSDNGFFTFDSKSQKLKHFLHDPDKPQSLSDNHVRQILIDQAGQPWMLIIGGINRINLYANTFKYLQKNSHAQYGFGDNDILSLSADIKGDIWIGTFRQSLYRTKIKDGIIADEFEHFVYDANDPYSIGGSSIWSIYEDNDGTMWFGTTNDVNKYDANTNKFTRYALNPGDKFSLTYTVAEAMFEDSHGIFWVGTRRGLNILGEKTGKLIPLLPDKNDSTSIYSTFIHSIFEDSQGELWFCGSKLERLNRKDTSFTHNFSGPNNSDLLHVYKIKEDDSTNLWMASGQGLIHYKRNTNTFEILKKKDGLQSEAIIDVEIDQNGDIWATSSQGLSRIRYDTREIKNYHHSDGLIDRGFNFKNGFTDRDGWLYFGSLKGLMYFHPDSLKDNKFIPPVYITALFVDGRQKFLEKPVYETTGVELNYKENDVSFDFVALNYVNPQKNQYAYKLEGYDEDWNHAGNRHTAYYTNLDPGTYTFKVKGSNNDGYWNEEGASLTVIIYPPFWKTSWAYLLYTFVFIGLLYLLRKYEMNRLRLKQNLEINIIEAEKHAELDIEKNKFFSNISHEFRTPLTLILGPLNRIIGKTANVEQKDELSLVRRNAQRLQVLINQLLSLSKLESGQMKLKACPENIVRLTRVLVESFHSMAEDRGIKVDFESEAEEYMVYIDALKYEKVVNNLLSNAFKFTEKGGKIKVSVTPLPPSREKNPNTGVQIKFADTGIGIHQDKLEHVFDRFYQVDEKQMRTNLGTGIGLALTKELVELHHGTITVDSESGMGTTFTIFLPQGKDHLSTEEIFEASPPAELHDQEYTEKDYLFVQDLTTKSETKPDTPYNNNLPLVLIVEDNDDMRTYIKSYLTDSYNIIEAANGREGAEKAIEQIPDLIVSDLMMPHMDGSEMTTRLKSDERTSHIPIILLTAKASRESKLEGLELGADDFLTKPFDSEELVVRIKNLIEQRKKLRAVLSQYLGDPKQTSLIRESSGKMISKLDEQFLEKATALVHEHMSNPEFSVDMLAHEMSVSRMQLHRKLTGLTDHSASDLIRNIRLMRAAELLKAGDLNVTEITYEIGISSLSNFSKIFKEKYGVSPTEYK